VTPPRSPSSGTVRHAFSAHPPWSPAAMRSCEFSGLRRLSPQCCGGRSAMRTRRRSPAVRKRSRQSPGSLPPLPVRQEYRNLHISRGKSVPARSPSVPAAEQCGRYPRYRMPLCFRVSAAKPVHSLSQLPPAIPTTSSSFSVRKEAGKDIQPVNSASGFLRGSMALTKRPGFLTD
jgi:hypothetical protein